MSSRPNESRITSKGQTTIPIEVREHLGIGTGDTIQFVYIDGHYEIIPRNRPAVGLFGRLQEYALPDTSPRNYRDAVADYFSDEDNQRDDTGKAA